MAKLDLALCCGVVFLVAVAGSTRAQTDPRADIVVYGDHAFTTFRDGVSFQNPRDYREDGDDPITRLKYETVPGMQNVLGTVQWGSEAYGKYVLLGDYKSIFQTAADQRIGIFDSERKTFCSLDVDPNVVGTQGSQRTLIAANPIARQSRIFFAGNGSVIGSSLGFIRADLDVDDPCTWQVTLISPAAMNGSLPPAKQPCPNNACEFDGLGLLAHEDVPGDPYGRDTIVVGDYYSPRVSVIQVGATGVTAL